MTTFYTKQAIRFLTLFPTKEAACAGLCDQHVKNGYKLRECLNIGNGEYTLVFELVDSTVASLAASLRDKLVALQAREPVVFSQLVAGSRLPNHRVQKLSVKGMTLLSDENFTDEQGTVQDVVVEVIHEYVHGDGMDLAIRPFTAVSTEPVNGNATGNATNDQNYGYNGGNGGSHEPRPAGKPHDLRERRNQG